MSITWRVLSVLCGAFLLLANNGAGDEGTVLGFYPPDSSQRIGFDIAKLAIAALALWMIARGFGLVPRARDRKTG